ncbi:uncharacterized protein LOC105628182 isoform X2 [Jatropha curcas]|uniref:uncharacterized protein LOC105628182 isoform X2 n=1 Tax=Jatropha curcas TaxID=180498 RepID=UPI0009D688D6|nr:uncharacterized protein LOC105628182 isoform X2 [Jatropha curcas]
MYGHSNTTFSRADFVLGHYPPSPEGAAPSPLISGQFLPPAHLIVPDQLAGGGFDFGSSTNSGCSSYSSPSSLASCGTNQQTSLIQRSISSHSLQKNGYHCHFTCPQDFLDLDTCPVRRVFSTGDLQHGHKADSPLSSESSVIIESMSKACKYSPEEKKERIESTRVGKRWRIAGLESEVDLPEMMKLRKILKLNGAI